MALRFWFWIILALLNVLVVYINTTIGNLAYVWMNTLCAILCLIMALLIDKIGGGPK